MKAVVTRILENNLNDLKGLSIEGEIPISEDFLNDLISVFMESGSYQASPEQKNSTSKRMGIDFSQLLNALDKKEVKIEFKDKLALLKINAKKF